MRWSCTLIAATVVFGALLGSASAQLNGPDIYINDGTNDRLIRMVDLDRDGLYKSPGEYVIFHRTALATAPMSMRFYATPSSVKLFWAQDDDEGSKNQRVNDGIFFGDLRARTGRLNQSELTRFYTIDDPDDVVFDPAKNTLFMCNDGAVSTVAGQGPGLFRLIDLNNDGDAMDTGEATLMVASSLKVTVPGKTAAVTIGGDDFEGLGGLDSRGYLLAYEQTDEVVYAFKDLNNDGDFADVNEAVNFLNYSTKLTGLVTNPDFLSTKLPGLGGLRFANLELIDVDTTSTADAYYFGVYWGPSTPFRQGHIYRGVDKNQNGHLNDAGEVTLFYDGATGLTSSINIGVGMRVFLGQVYLTDNDNFGSNKDRIIRLTDLNNDGDALDTGEQIVLHADGNQPFNNTLAIVSAGTIPWPNSLQGQTTLMGTAKGGQSISFILSDLAGSDSGGVGYVGLSFYGDGRATKGIPLSDGINRYVPLDFDKLTELSLTVLLPSFTTGTIANGVGLTKGFKIPAGMPPGVKIYAAGVIWTGSRFGSITDAVSFVTQ